MASMAHYMNKSKSNAPTYHSMDSPSHMMTLTQKTQFNWFNILAVMLTWALLIGVASSILAVDGLNPFWMSNLISHMIPCAHQVQLNNRSVLMNLLYTVQRALNLLIQFQLIQQFR